MDGLQDVGLIATNSVVSTFVGALVAWWKMKTPRKIAVENETVPVRQVKTVCDERHDMITHQMEDVFGRLRRLEANDAAQSAKLDAIDRRVESMDGKLDRIIAKIG